MVFLLLLLLFNTYHHHHHNTSIIRSIIYRRHRRWYLLLLSLLFWMIKRMDGWMNECKDRVWSNDFFFVDEHCVSGMNRSLYRLFNWKWIGGTMSSFFFLFPLTLSFVVVVVAGNQWSWCFSIWWNGSNRIVFIINLGHQTKKKHRANNNSFSSYLWWQWWWWWSQSWPVFIKMYGVVSIIIIMFKIIEWKLMGEKMKIYDYYHRMFNRLFCPSDDDDDGIGHWQWLINHNGWWSSLIHLIRFDLFEMKMNEL